MSDIRVIKYGIAGPAGPPGTDLTFNQSFVNQTTVTVTHNLGKFPSVTMVDTAKTEFEVDVTHVDNNSLIASWSTQTSGTVYCN
jgi:hypothetical protein